MATVAGLFEHASNVNEVIEALHALGFGDGDVSVAAPFGLTVDDLQGGYTRAPEVEDQQKPQGILVTVVAEGEAVDRVRDIFSQKEASSIDVRYNVWERGTVEDYIEATDTQRDRRSDHHDL